MWGDAQPGPKRVAHRGNESGPVRRIGDLSEEPKHQPAVDPVLSFQPFGDVDAEVVADHIRLGLAQHQMGGVDRIECSANPLTCLLTADRETHSAILSNVCANPPVFTQLATALWMKRWLCIPRSPGAASFLAFCLSDVQV